MTTINNLTIEQMREIVSWAPDWAVSVNLHNGMYYELREYRTGDTFLSDLRTAIAKHDEDHCNHEWNDMTSNGDNYRSLVCKHCDSTKNYLPLDEDHVTDIRNHLSPSTKVIDHG
ncbi:hypothetical protein [Acinetobacter bereziniae]|uniref:hypothetical protein n=1 Tax=Acinetobacter bereziniae TaxID=106648 RepID=UPI003AF97446